jgi:hypothetical protein
MAAVTLVDVAALDRAAGELLGILDDVTQDMPVKALRRLELPSRLRAGDGRTKSVQNLVTHAALHVRLRLG